MPIGIGMVYVFKTIPSFPGCENVICIMLPIIQIKALFCCTSNNILSVFVLRLRHQPIISKRNCAVTLWRGGQWPPRQSVAFLRGFLCRLRLSRGRKSCGKVPAPSASKNFSQIRVEHFPILQRDYAAKRTSRTPSGGRAGSANVALSCKRFGSNTVTSAARPTPSVPRSRPKRAAASHVVFAMPSFSESNLRSNTYCARKRANAPAARGCPAPLSRTPSLPSMVRGCVSAYLPRRRSSHGR